MGKLLELQQVSREFSGRRGFFSPVPARIRAVDGISLEIASGETLGLVGESGCGKSTLARMAVGLLEPTSGEVLLDGRAMREWTAPERARRIQMVFQDPFSSLNPRRRVGDSITEPLLIADKSAGRRLQRHFLRAAGEELLLKVGLRAEHFDRYPHEFSGGQRQRIAVARALSSGAAAVVCDEPVSALDASVQAQVLNLLRDIQDERGLGYLFISHDLGVIGFMSSRIAVMYLGRIMEEAPRGELLAHPAHPYTAALMASAPSRDIANRGSLPVLSGEMPSPLAPPPGCVFHPRCPCAKPECRESEPALKDMGGGHTVRCHHPL
ncbi:MAG: ATP-binding cassette domain-containing protein [Mailhella sp.]|nr:ATP-binding cassette domain-containing protein [Mailhella sp.]